MTNIAHPEAAAAEKSEKTVFTKPNLEPGQLIEKLEKQGMGIDPKSALPYLEQVGGYRMKGYWYHWLDPDTKVFRKGVHFNQVIERYEFDRELRRVTADALERLELMVRAAISNVMSKHEGPHWFTNAAVFVPAMPDPAGGVQHRSKKRALIDKVTEEVERMKRKPFIVHFSKKYSEPALPPSWVISECLSFGSWSTAYPTLLELDYRKEISRRFKVEEPDVFASWLHALSVMRNTVAHHGRLLGAMTSVTPKEYYQWNIKFTWQQARTFFVTATVINFLCQSVKRGPEWKSDLEALFAKYPDISIQKTLGFPANWQEAPGWQPKAVKPSRRRRQKNQQNPTEGALGTALKVALAKG